MANLNPSLRGLNPDAFAPNGEVSTPADVAGAEMGAEEAKTVEGRVSGWMEDTLAEARVRGGLPHHYVYGVRDALTAGLNKVGREAFVATQDAPPAMFDTYFKSAGEYAATGRPDLNIGAPGSNPTAFESFNERAGSDPSTIWLRALVQSNEMRREMAARPAFSLKLEITQGRQGELLAASVVESSGHKTFDAFVLRVVPQALASVDQLPDELARRERLRTLWEIEGRLRLSKQLEEALSAIDPGVYGLTVGNVLRDLELSGSSVEFHTRLLRVY